jgi:phage protein D
VAPNVDRPVFTIKAIREGKGAQPLDIADRVLSFEYVDEERRADKLCITLDNFDLSVWDDPTFRKGTILEVAYGYVGRMSPVRRAFIQSVKGGRQVTIEAHGMAMVLHKIRRSRVWENSTLASIASQIAANYGSEFNIQGGALSKNIVVDPALDVPRTRHQVSETDATFLSRLARRHGLEFYVDSQGLHFKQRNLAQAPVKEFVWYNGDGHLLDYNVENNVTARPGSVTKKGIDPLSKKTLSHTAENGSDKRSGLAPVIEIVDPITGASSNQSRAAESHTEHSTEVTPSGIKAHAEGNFRKTKHATIHLNYSIFGDPDVLAKRVYIFGGLGKRISGRYYATQVTHKIDHGGYITSGTCKMDGHGGYGKNNIGSKAALNKKDPKQGPTEIEVVDARTGTTHTEYRKSGEEN